MPSATLRLAVSGSMIISQARARTALAMSAPSRSATRLSRVPSLASRMRLYTGSLAPPFGQGRVIDVAPRLRTAEHQRRGVEFIFRGAEPDPRGKVGIGDKLASER